MKLMNLLVIGLIFSSFCGYSQRFDYGILRNVVQISDCGHPKNGFVLLGNTISKTANNDSFTLDVTNKSFTWSDNKGAATQKIYNYQKKITDLNTQYVFNTESNLIRITTNYKNEAVIEIISLLGNQWKCFSYLCKVK